MCLDWLERRPARRNGLIRDVRQPRENVTARKKWKTRYNRTGEEYRKVKNYYVRIRREERNFEGNVFVK